MTILIYLIPISLALGALFAGLEASNPRTGPWFGVSAMGLSAAGLLAYTFEEGDDPDPNRSDPGQNQ